MTLLGPSGWVVKCLLLKASLIIYNSSAIFCDSFVWHSYANDPDFIEGLILPEILNSFHPILMKRKHDTFFLSFSGENLGNLKLGHTWIFFFLFVYLVIFLLHPTPFLSGNICFRFPLQYNPEHTHTGEQAPLNSNVQGYLVTAESYGWHSVHRSSCQKATAVSYGCCGSHRNHLRGRGRSSPFPWVRAQVHLWVFSNLHQRSLEDLRVGLHAPCRRHLHQRCVFSLWAGTGWGADWVGPAVTSTTRSWSPYWALQPDTIPMNQNRMWAFQGAHGAHAHNWKQVW